MGGWSISIPYLAGTSHVASSWEIRGCSAFKSSLPRLAASRKLIYSRPKRKTLKGATASGCQWRLYQKSSLAGSQYRRVQRGKIVAEAGAEASPEQAGALPSASEPPAQDAEVTTSQSLPEAAPRPADHSPQPKASTSKSEPAWLYEPAFGLPIVRKKLKYADLLREIRQGKIREISYFDSNVAEAEAEKEYNVGVEGYCLVVYNDGKVAQAFLPPWDVRAAYAMETHGVLVTRLRCPPGPGGILDTDPTIGVLQGKFLAALPVIFLVGTYLAVQLAQWLKGDMADRMKIRQYDIQREKLAKQQAAADDLAMGAREMAGNGWDVDRICMELDHDKVPYSRAYIERLVAEQAAKEQQEAGQSPGKEEETDSNGALVVSTEQQAREQAMLARMREEADSQMTEMDKARDMLKMKSVKIQRATSIEDPEQEEMRIRMRKAQRQMKGVKLQYTDDRITFDDVAGIGDSKIELTEVVDFFTKPGRFKASGARVPKGVLLCGPPGTGKTLLARAVAGEARVAFLSLNASEFVEMFAGLGASRVRDLFAQARALAPAIIFIDEIDAVGRKRGGAKGNDERDQTLNQLLTEMDGFSEDSGVIVMAATNRKDVLDPALVRPGRFDRIITVGLPDFDGRIEILKVHLGYRPHEDDLDYKLLSFETQSFSGAMLANLVNSAAYVAAREDRDSVCMDDFTRALIEDRLGPQRRGVYSPERQRRLAVQEGATALVCTLLPAIEPLVSVTIVPREKFPLGQTVVKVNEQRERTNLFTRRYLEEQLLTVLAGRAAEELVYGEDEMSTINQRRLVMARRITTKLIVSGAMTENPKIGPRTLTVPFDTGSRSLRQLVPEHVTSETTYAADLEMEKVMAEAYEHVKALLVRNRAALDAIIHKLSTPQADEVSVETFVGNTLDGDQVREIVNRLGDKSDLARRDAEKAVFM